MTVTGSDAPEERTRVDPEPPSFPRVSTDSTGDQRTPAVSVGSIFSRPETAPVEPAWPAAGRQVGTQALQGGNSRYRWLIAIAATIAVLAVVGGIVLAMAPSAGTPSITARYAPADTVALLEARLDLPGDQDELLASFMSHFPGFADQQAFDQKLTETIAEAFGSVASGYDWATDVEPWFGGEVSAFTSSMAHGADAHGSFTVAMTVTDPAALESILAERVIAVEGATSEDHQGVLIWTVPLPEEPDASLALAATDEVLLIGSSADQVKAALDVGTDRTPGLADDEFYLQQLAELHADRLGTFYLDTRSADALLDQLPAGQLDPEMLRRLLDLASVRVVGEVRAESDHLAVVARTLRGQGSDLPPLPANGTSDLAQAAPADALVYVEVRQAGDAIGYLLESALQPAAIPTGSALDPRMLEQLLGVAPRDFFDFVKDAAIWGTYSDDAPSAGVVATVDDQAVASQRVERLLGALRSLAAFGGEITIDEQQVGDVAVSVINLDGALGGTPMGSISVAFDGGMLYVGIGDFVADALNQSAADSLASRADYQAAMAAAGGANAGSAFADLDRLQALAETSMPPASQSTYEQDKKPFVDPLSHLVLIRKTDGAISVENMFLYVE